MVGKSFLLSRLPLSVRRGLGSGVACLALLMGSMLPSRLASVMHRHGEFFEKILRVGAGAVLDLSAVIAVIVPVIFVLAVAPALLMRPRARWQQLAAALLSLPWCFALYLLAVTAQEVKSERGAYPTMFDLAEGGGNAAFVTGALGFIRLDRIWVPLVVYVMVTILVLATAAAWSRRDGSQPLARSGWSLGLATALVLGVVTVQLMAKAQAAIANRASPAALGDPLTGIVESSFDMVRHQSAPTPRELIVQIALPPGSELTGAKRMGWPPFNSMPAPKDSKCTHPYSRPLDFKAESQSAAAPAHALLTSLQQLSRLLFAEGDGRIAVFQLSLESFRADDIAALHSEASPQIDPFTNGLYDSALKNGGSEGVLASTKMFQAGVRTAQGLGAITCGVGTLPYNLSIIRDLQPFAMRCAGDVLRDAGFRGSFFYGSDATFDEMHRFMSGHGYTKIVSQVELPKDLPIGAWDGVTDFALFHAATEAISAALNEEGAAPVLSLVMSLSNHSPYTPPQDLPVKVTERVDRALTNTVNRADVDDRRRLLTHSYTDAATEQFFAELEATRLAERSIVLMSADHSTGESYVWGPADPESDEAKAQIPFVIVIPKAFMARVKDQKALMAALKATQTLLNAAVLSQNDVPSLMLALLSEHPAVKALPASAKWHTLGGQMTSPWFDPGGDARSFLVGINGVSELFTLDKTGVRVGDYEDSVFLKTRADRYRVTPRLIPAAATLATTMKNARPCEE